MGIGSDLLVGRMGDGRLIVFAAGRFLNVRECRQRAPNGDWSGWAEVPIGWTTPPAVAASEQGRLNLFSAATDAVNHVWQTSEEGGWSRVELILGVRPTSGPVAGRNADGRLEVFVCGASGEIQHNWQREADGNWVATAGRWPSLQGLATAVDAELAVASNVDGRLELFAADAGGDLHHTSQRYPNGGFGPWQPMGASSRRMPAVAANVTGRLEVVAATEPGDLLHAVQRESFDGFGDWAQLEGTWLGAPAVATDADGRLVVLARGTDRALYHTAQLRSSAAFGGWTPLGGTWAGDPAVGRNEDGRLDVFAKADDGAVYHCLQDSPGAGFGGWQVLGHPDA